MKKRILHIAVLGIGSVLVSCAELDIFAPDDRPLRILPEEIEVLVNERATLSVELLRPSEPVASHSVQWRSYGPAIASVSGTGVVTALRAGTTAITAERRGARATARATVRRLPFDGVTTGRLHGCGWGEAGAYCWGVNGHGRLGSDVGELDCGGAPCTFRPERVETAIPFARLAAGAEHTCGLDADGRAYCWGRNVEGQLGIGSADDAIRAAPQPVAGGLVFAAIVAGGAHSCGLTADGQAFCWGDNEFGQLGNGTLTPSAAPAPSAWAHRFQTLTAGESHTCGLVESGAAYCWGRNSNRQLGDGTTRNSVGGRLVIGGVAFRAITAGDIHTCGIATDGVAHCWGSNGQGQSGTGSIGGSANPGPVAGGHRYAAIAAGGSHTCAVTEAGAALCWGANRYRQLGNESDSVTGSGTPVATAGTGVYADVSAGWLHSCARTAGGDTRCWGHNGGGQLGRDDIPQSCPGEPAARCSIRPIPIFGSH